MIFDVRTISTLEKNKVSVPLGGITKEVLIKNFGENDIYVSASSDVAPGVRGDDQNTFKCGTAYHS